MTRRSPSIVRITACIAVLLGAAPPRAAVAAPSPADVLGARAANQSAMARYKKKDWAGALADLRKAIALHPDHARYHYNLACVASLAGDLDTARRQLQELGISPQPEAGERLRKALADPDLEAARKDPAILEILQIHQPRPGTWSEQRLAFAAILPGFVPDRIARPLDAGAPEALAARKLLGPPPKDHGCAAEAEAARRIFAVAAELDPQRPGEERLYAALDGGLVVADAKGERIAGWFQPRCRGGAEDALVEVAVGAVREDGSAEVVVSDRRGGRGGPIESTAAFALRAGRLSPLFDWSREAGAPEELGVTMTGLAAPEGPRLRALRLEAPGLLSLRDGPRTRLLRFDAAAARFQEVTPPPPPRPARTEARKRGGPSARTAPLPPLPELVAIKSVTATSTYADKKRPQRYAPDNVVFYEAEPDDEGGTSGIATMWCEGKADEGIGESVTITLAAPARIDALVIAPGVWRNERLFLANNRVTRLDVIADGKAPIAVKPQGARAPVEVRLGGGAVTSITIRIAAVRKGRMNDSCLAAVQLVRDGKLLAPIADVPVAALAALPQALGEIQYALDEDAASPARLGKLLAFPFRTGDKSCQLGGCGAPGPHDHPALASVIEACRRWERLDVEQTMDAPHDCPLAANVDPEDDRGAEIAPAGPASVAVTFPSHNELCTEWTLVYAEGRWRLRSIDANGCNFIGGVLTPGMFR